MKPPANDMAKELQDWPSPPARGNEAVQVTPTTTVASSRMVVPGDGDVECSPNAGMIVNTAKHYAGPMERFGGSGYVGNKRGPQK